MSTVLNPVMSLTVQQLQPQGTVDGEDLSPLVREITRNKGQ